MSLLERTRHLTDPQREDPVDWRAMSVAAGYGVIGALSLALLLLVPALVAWVADPHSSVGWMENLSFVASAWTMIHRGALGVAGDGIHRVVLAPLLLTALATYLARTAARTMLSSLEDAPSDRPWWHAPAGFVGGYTLTGFLLAIVGGLGATQASLWQVVPGALAVGVAGMGWAQWREESDEDREETDRPMASALEQLGERLPDAVPRGLRPAMEGVLGFLGLGVVLVVALAAFHIPRMMTIGDQLDAGLAGTVVLWLLQTTVLPNLALYAGAWLTGASVHLGAVTITGGGVQAGVLPMLPMLGAVPEAGPFPGWAGVAPVLVVLLGAGIGWRASRRHTLLAPLKAKVVTAATAAVIAAVVLSALMWVAGASISPGVMEHVGTTILVLPLLLLELGLGACACAVAAHWLRTRR